MFTYKIPLFILQFIPFVLHAQIGSRPFGTQNALIGNISSCYPANFASLNNPALLGLNPNTTLAISHELPYLQSKLAVSALSFQTQFKDIPLGISLIQSGNEFFKQHIVSVGLAKKISNQFSIGLALNYLGTYQHQYERFHNVYGSVGFTLKINKQLLLSKHLIHPTASANKVSRVKNIGQFYQIGLSYSFSKNIILLSELQGDTKSNWQIKFGVLYQIKPQIDLRIGFPKNVNSFSGGVLIHSANMKWVLGIQVNRILGSSPSTEFNYAYK